MTDALKIRTDLTRARDGYDPFKARDAQQGLRDGIVAADPRHRHLAGGGDP
jgi:hypothetical protein